MPGVAVGAANLARGEGLERGGGRLLEEPLAVEVRALRRRLRGRDGGSRLIEEGLLLGSRSPMSDASGLTLIAALKKWVASQPDKMLHTYLNESGKVIDSCTYAQLEQRSG